MKTKPILISLAVVAIALGIYFFKVYFKPAFEFAGTIEATRIDLPSRIATVVRSIEVSEGQVVKKDQLLARLACEDVELAHSLANENYQRALNLKQTGSISKEAIDLSFNKKQEADTRFSWCEIKSPVDGTVLSKYLEPTEWVNPGTKILTVANLDALWTYFYVSQELMSKLSIGARVTGHVPEISKSFSGTIVKINEEAEFTPKNVQTQSERTRLVFGIKVAFNNDGGFLKPGMTIQSQISVEK
jgi:HlyD family secretion protein